MRPSHIFSFFLLGAAFALAACNDPLQDEASEDTAAELPAEEVPPATSTYTFTLPANPTGLCWGALRLTATAQGGGRIYGVTPAGGDTLSSTNGSTSLADTWYWRLSGGRQLFDKDYTSWNAVTYPSPWRVVVTYTGSRPRLSYWYTDTNWDCGNP